MVTPLESDLRHGLASNARNSDASVLEVSKLLGHANVAVTSDIYGHLDPRPGREAIALAAASVPSNRLSAIA
jgi:integrase